MNKKLKKTRSLKIAERYGFQYVSVGELLRKKMIHNATSNRKWSLIAKIITNGELAPQDFLLELLCDAVASSLRQGKGLLVSGFPRDLRQAEEYESKVRKTNRRRKRLQKSAETSEREKRRSCSINLTPLTQTDASVFLQIDAERSPDEVFAQICQFMESPSPF
uniref:Uncharacterized protein n=1 Tax=Acanthochromis polyacanthus TaxID=80966 RepID=A0A3Q1GXH7_9TELE